MSALNPLREQKPSVPKRLCQSTPLSESLLHLLLEGTFSDVTFIVGPSKERIPCHQLFLKARSPVFEAMFSDDWSQGGMKEVPLEDINPTIFQMFLHYIYAEACLADASEALELLHVAQTFEVQLLVDMCEELLESEASLDNDVVDVVQAAQKHDQVRLMDKVSTQPQAVDNNEPSQVCLPSSGPDELYPRGFGNSKIRRKYKQLFERRQMCIYVVGDMAGLPSRPPPALTSSQPVKKKVVLSGMTLYCPTTVTNSHRRTATPSTKDFNILVTARRNDRKNYHDVSTLSTVKAEEGKVTEVEFHPAVPLERGKYFRFIVKEMRRTAGVGDEDYEVNDFGKIIESVVTPVGGSRVFVGCTSTGSGSFGTNGRCGYPQLIYKLRFKEC